MEIKNTPWNTKQLTNMLDRGSLSLEYPIQRASGQWNEEQQSYLIHSVASDYPIPPLYFLGTEGILLNPKNNKEEKATIRFVIDGVQRLSTIADFINNKYALSKKTPPVTVDSIEYDIAGKRFDELDEEVREMIVSRTILTYTIDSKTTSDEDIEDLFYRMNNGKALTPQQKLKSVIGKAWAELLNEIGGMDIFERMAFSTSQLKGEAHIQAILQTMMLMEDVPFSKLSPKELHSYALSFKKEETEEVKLNSIEKIKDILNFLNDSIPLKKEKVLTKKINLPMLILTAIMAKDKGISSLEFGKWTEVFRIAVEEGTTDYVKYTGVSSTDKAKVLGRLEEMQKHFMEYFNLTQNENSIENETVNA